MIDVSGENRNKDQSSNDDSLLKDLRGNVKEKAKIFVKKFQVSLNSKGEQSTLLNSRMKPLMKSRMLPGKFRKKPRMKPVTI